jgi:hypothetical protein
MTTSYPVAYEKGNQRRLAHTPADAAKYRFDGFKAVATELDYDALKDEAKGLGVPIKGTKEELAKAVEDARSNPAGNDDNDANEGDKTVDTVGTPTTTSTPPAGASTGPVDAGGRSAVR